ncbi:MAG: hypothetical protein OEV78_11230 [Spirochaetia bacterium]|nr:hypothetical protein [Spirochaetia bacterium]
MAPCNTVGVPLNEHVVPSIKRPTGRVGVEAQLVGVSPPRVGVIRVIVAFLAKL